MVTAPPPFMRPAVVERTALQAARPFYEGSTTPSPAEPRVTSIRFVQASGRRAWIVHVSARWFVFRCPAPPPDVPANICVAGVAGELVVHVKDATGRAYSVVPVSS